MTLEHHHRQDINTFGLELDNVRTLLGRFITNSYVYSLQTEQYQTESRNCNGE